MERVVSDKIEGIYRDKEGTIERKSKKLMIIYSKKGSHLYPRKDE